MWRDHPFSQPKKQDNRMNEQWRGGWKQHRRGRGLDKIWKRGGSRQYRGVFINRGVRNPLSTMVKYVFWKAFKNSKKLLTSPFLLMVHIGFTRRAFKEKLGIQRQLQGHSKAFPRVLYGHSKGTRRALGYSGTWGTRAIKGRWRHSGTLALGHSSNSKHFM